MTAEEVRNGAFVYRDALLAEVSEGKRHARASATELKDLLLPKKNSAPVKDQVSHWYEAQLVHYGLPRVKDKNAAKLRLLGAVNAGSLNVPEHIKELEAQLKKEYASSQRKAKNATKKTGVTSTSNDSKKRKADGMNEAISSSTSFSFQHGDLSIQVSHKNSTQGTSVKKPKKQDIQAKETTTSKTGAKAGTKTTITKPNPSPARKSSSTKTKASRGPKSTTQLSPSRPIGNHPRPKQTARRGQPFDYRAAVSSRSSAPAVANDDEPPPPYTEYDDEEEESDPEPPARGVQISGVYTAYSSSDSDPCELILRLSNPRDQLWGRFTIGSKTGIIRLDGLDNIAQSCRKSFGWRSEDEKTGCRRFGKGCDGWIQYDGRSGMRGCFHGLQNGQDVEFDGELEEGIGYEHDDEKEEAVVRWVEEWDDFRRRAYGQR